MDTEERPAKRWELTNAETRIAALEKHQEKEDKSRTWMYGALFVGFITLVDNVLVAVIVYYVLRIHR